MFALRLSMAKPSLQYTYGYKKSTVLVSLLNAAILFVAVAVILYESIEKFSNPTPLDGGAIAWVAAIGIVINAFTAYLFFADKSKDLNVKGAYLHMAADTLVSVGVLVSGIVIKYTGWNVIDPIIGIVVGLVILYKRVYDSLSMECPKESMYRKWKPFYRPIQMSLMYIICIFGPSVRLKRH